MKPSDKHLVLEPSAEVMVLTMAGVIGPRSRVLVVGSHRGDDAVYLATAGCSVVAIDISPAATAYAKGLARVFRVYRQRLDRKKGVYFINRDVLATSKLEEDSFDLVWDRLLMSNLDPPSDAQAFVAEMARLLRDGGIFYSAYGTSSDDRLSAAEEKVPRGLFLKRWFTLFRAGTYGKRQRVARPIFMPLYPARNTDFATSVIAYLLERKPRLAKKHSTARPPLKGRSKGGRVGSAAKTSQGSGRGAIRG